MEIQLLLIPMLAGGLVTLTHIPLGREVLRRGIIFIDLCIAQVAALGMIVAQALGLSSQSLFSAGLAVAFALAVAALLSWTEKRWPALQEAIIGSVYVLSASMALLVLAHDPHGTEVLHQLLAGQILWVLWPDLMPLALASALLITVWALRPASRQRLFYLGFAIVITAAVQLIGIFLVFASLILPALAMHQGKFGLPGAYLLSLAAYLLGLSLSFALDLPAGPLIICSLASLGFMAVLLRSTRITTDTS